MNIIVGIDGTGAQALPSASRDAEYDRDFANSFVTRIARTANPNSAYWRGPLIGGGGLVP